MTTDKDHKCDVCGKENVTAHEYTSDVTPPTYNEQGYTTYTCNCGHSYVGDYVDKLIGVAEVNGVAYGTLAEAVAAAQNGDTVKLVAAIDLGAGYIVISKNITLDLGEFTITSTSNVYAAITVGTAGNATVTATTGGIVNNVGDALGNYGKLTVNGGNYTGYYALYNYNNTTAPEATINGGIFRGVDGETVSVANCGKLTITGGTVSGELNSSGVLTVNGGAVDQLTMEAVDYEASCENKTVIIGGTVSTVNAAAQIGNAYYATLADAVASAENGQTIKLLSDVTVTGVIDATGKTIDLNGKTMTGTVFGTLNMNGGTLVTADDFKMIGADGAYYQTEDAVFAFGADYSINLISGTTTLSQSWQTLPNQTLIVGKNATFVIPEGMTFGIRGFVTVNGTIDKKGTVILQTANATVTAEAGMNVITDVADSKVAYVDGTYKVVAKIYVASIGEQKFESLAEAVAAAQNGDTVKLVADIDLGAGYIVISKNITLDLGEFTITSTSNVYAAITVGTAGNATVTATTGGIVNNVGDALGNYGKLTVNGGNYTGYYALYNYNNTTAPEATINGGIFRGVDGETVSVANCGKLTITGGTVSGELNSSGVLTVNGGAVDQLTMEAVDYEASCENKTVIIGGTVSTVNAAAQIGNAYYATLADAVASAENGQTITLLTYVELEQPVLLNGAVLDLNGNHIKGTILGKLVMNKGTLITEEGYYMIGADAKYYSTEDAVMVMDNKGNITLESGTTTLAETWWTLENQVLTIGENAKFVIPADKTLYVRATVIVEGEAIVDGQVVLYETYSTVKAEPELNVVMREGIGDKVYYTEDGVYTVHTHTKVIDTAKAATCTETGLTEGKHCSVCGEVLVAQEVVPAKGHTEVIDTAKAATCTATGLTEGKHCSVCNVTLVAQEVVTAKGHTEVIDASKAATCTETGLTEGKHCSVCNVTLVAQEVVPAKGHTEVIDAGYAATCTETGLTEGKHCSVCNVTLVAQEVVTAKGHTEVIDAAKAATCTEAGLTEGKHCSVCNVTLVAQEVVTAKGHTEVIDASKAATCTETGLTEGKHCSVCNETLIAQEVVRATGHTEVVITGQAPTCTATGLTAGKRCDVCGVVTVAQEVVAKAAHTVDGWNSNDEYHWQFCSVCEDEVHIDEHEYVGGVCKCGKQESAGGEEEPDDEVLVDEDLRFSKIGLSFKSYIGVQLILPKNVTSSYTSVSVVVNGVEVEPDNRASVYMYEIQAYATEMTKEYTIAITGVTKDGKTVAGQQVTTSVELLTLEKLGEYHAAGNTQACTVLMDMIKYGAAAQEKFNSTATIVYPTAGEREEFAEYESYATTTVPEVTLENSEPVTDTISNKLFAMSLRSILTINVPFNQRVDAYDVRVTANGQPVDSETAVVSLQGNTSFLRIYVGATLMRTEYTIGVYEKGTDNLISQIMTCSAEGCAGAYLNDPNASKADKAVMIAMLRYGDSVNKLT